MLAVVGGCGQSELGSVSSSLEAGTPPTPVYTRMRNDAVTGDNTPVVVTGTSANCTPAQPCFVADPGADSYVNDEFERPAGQGTAAASYLPSLDITRSDTGLDANWLFYRINLYGVQPGSVANASGSLPNYYGVEINLDNDPMGDLILQINQPSLNVGTNWGTTALEARLDQNETMGGPRPLLPDGPGQAGGGYEHRVFDGGQNFQPSQPGGTTAVQARINGAAVEIAIYRPVLASLTNVEITSFGFRPYAAGAQVSTSELYTQDDVNRAQLGSPYPWLTLAGAPATCPSGSSGDDGLTAAQVAALESGTNVDTNIKNPCYAVGGIYQRDNAGTLAQLAQRDDLSVKVDLSLTKTDSPDPATQNGTLVYTLTVNNTLPTTVTGVVVT
ncbi:MAG TPA: hypothetical protein VLB44_27220, partial [Kofleriaceae bacterium]|nr:hypothetical protein [Kofleriaceae bacterium]